MGIRRKELIKVYEEIRSRYRRKNRDIDIVEGIDTLYQALIDYMDGCYYNSKN